MCLTNKQIAFINEYLKDFNATQSAIRAGYSAKSAATIGWENLIKPEIDKEIKRLVAEKAMGKDEVLLRLADVARGDIADLLDIESMSFDIDLRKAQENGKTKLIRKVKQITKTTTSNSGEDTETNIQEIELYSSLEALQTLAKIHGLLTDRVDITTKGEKITEIGVKAVDYRAGLAALAPGSMGDSNTPGEGESFSNGQEMG